jgi:hypothetical protein
MSNKQQTAVDWLEIVLIPDPISEEDFEHNINCWKQAKEMEKQQAKEMEREQIINAFNRGRFWNMSWDGNSYYEEIISKGNNE